MSKEVKTPPKGKGVVSQITRGSNVDGPGFRTTVFFKGCPLRCDWCHNPETQRLGIELLYDDRLCIEDCSECLKACEYQAIVPREAGRIDRDACVHCVKCVEECPTEAIKMVGQEYTAEELFQEILRDKLLMHHSEGGVTFSGGEPLFQDTDFMVDLLKRCKEEGIHTAIDTCGAVDWSIFERVLPYASMFLYDIKHTSNKKVKAELALENLKKVLDTGAEMWIRIPFIPEFNATAEEVEKIGKFIFSVKCDNLKRINLLPFHRLPEAKYTMMARDWTLDNLPEQTEDDVKHWRGVLSEICGYDVIIGG